VSATSARPAAGVLKGGRVRDGVVAALVVLTLGGLLLAQHMKHLPAPVEGVVIQPANLTPGGRPLEISFHLDKPQRITVEVVTTTGKTVASLVRDLPWPANTTLCQQWNGRRGLGPAVGNRTIPYGPLGTCRRAPLLSQPTGRFVAAGEYHLRILFAGGGEPLPLPQIFTVSK